MGHPAEDGLGGPLGFMDYWELATDICARDIWEKVYLGVPRGRIAGILNDFVFAVSLRMGARGRRDFF